MKAHFRISPLPQLLLSLFFAGTLLAQETYRAFNFEADVKVPMRDGVQLAANNLAAESGAKALSSHAASARLTHWIPILRDA